MGGGGIPGGRRPAGGIGGWTRVGRAGGAPDGGPADPAGGGGANPGCTEGGGGSTPPYPTPGEVWDGGTGGWGGGGCWCVGSGGGGYWVGYWAEYGVD